MAFNLKNIFQRSQPDKGASEVLRSESSENFPSPSGEKEDRDIINSQLKALEGINTQGAKSQNESLENLVGGGSSSLPSVPLLDSNEKEETHPKGEEGEVSVEEKETSSLQEITSSGGDTYREKIEEKGGEEPPFSREISETEEADGISEEKKFDMRDQNQEKGPIPEIQTSKKEEGVPPVFENQPTLMMEDDNGPELPQKGKSTAKLVRFGIVGFIMFIILGGGAFAGVWLFRSFLATPPLPEKEVSQTPPAETPGGPVELTLAERDSKRIDDLDGLAATLSRYHNAFNSYPSTNGSIEKVFKDTMADSLLARELVPSYLSEVPTDPNATFYYGYSSDGSFYELTSLLENKDHAECLVSGNYCIRTIRNGEVVSKK